MQEHEKMKEKVKQQFAKNAQKYVASESHSQGNDLSLLIDWLRPTSDSVVLDIATGGGHVAKTLASHVSHVFATDLTEQMLENTARHLKQHGKNIWYVIADAESLPFLPNTFDIVTCRIAPHHFPNPDRFIEEVQRVLQPHGKFLLIDNVVPDDKRFADFMNTFEKLRDKSHVRCLSMREWQGLFAAKGLVEIRSLKRKKTYDYPTWVERTTANQEQIQRVSQYILSAGEDLRRYYSVIAENNQIQSLEVDEWMVLCEKR
ncbi:methyltransferase domain-containing protein [Fodinisporobacter ferrooxydans]|uniref:Methyltransferase domain-containing protein n=1 Tax=Fodinisporobacter ferrooxydans TaxID=2901836 RepID=A0ABY4CLI4_9BACL|nr:methyltransferase domain-containing protein [Alicyclobacillaceae bacterium MYW30-H2]